MKTKLRVGDTVICVHAEYADPKSPLTFGERYLVTQDLRSYLHVNGRDYGYGASRFIHINDLPTLINGPAQAIDPLTKIVTDLVTALKPHLK